MKRIIRSLAAIILVSSVCLAAKAGCYLFPVMEAADGQIFAGFCIESCCGVMDLCAERVAALNMYINSGQTAIKRILTFRDQPPCEEAGVSGMPCGACREFLYQLDERNEDAEIMTDYGKRETVTLKELLPNWWGKERYAAARR